MSGEKDNRRQLRFPLTGGEEVLGQLANRCTEARVEVADLSLGGARLVVHDPNVLQAQRGLHLDLDGPELSLAGAPVELVYVRHPRTIATEAHVAGVRFKGHDEAALRSLCRYLVHRNDNAVDQGRFIDTVRLLGQVKDAKHLGRLLKYCCRRQIKMKVFKVSGRRVGELLPEAFRDGRVVGRLVSRGPRDIALRSSCFLVVPSIAGVYVVPATVAGAANEQLSFKVLDHLLMGGVRKLSRHQPGSGTPVVLEYLHPLLPGKHISKVAGEIGLGGMSFVLDVDDDLMASGTVVDSALLRLPDGRSLSCRFVVRHTHRESDGGHVCGVEFVDFPARGRQRWVRHALSVQHPHVVEVSPDDLEAVWDVFDRSGYLAEKPIEYMKSMKRPFINTWRRLLRTEGGSRCWIYRDRGESVGTVSASRIYSRTWLMHHLGADLFHFERKRQNLAVIAELAPRTAMQWLAGLYPDGYVLTYFDAKKIFNKWSWFDFFERHNGKGQLVSQRVRVRDVQLDQAPLSAPPSEVWVRVATVDERCRISEDLLERDGPLVHDALDYTMDSMTLESMKQTGDGRVLNRVRRVYVAGNAADVEGYAIVEGAAVGTNIFSLYETCRIVLMERSDADTEAAVRDALFFRIQEFYRERGSPSFLYLIGQSDAPPPPGDGFEAEAVRTVVASRLYTRWTEDVDSIWALG